MIPLGLFQKAKQLRVLFVTLADIVLLDDPTLQMLHTFEDYDWGATQTR
jgi:hypothetical protein